MADNDLVPLEAELAVSREAAFVDAVASGADIVEASSIAAYADRSGGELASGREPVQKAIRAAVERKIKTEGLGLAYKTMKRLMTSGAPPAVQLAAAKWMAEAAGIGPKGDAPGDKPIGEMSTKELERVIADAQRVVDQAARLPTMIDVTPSKRA